MKKCATDADLPTYLDPTELYEEPRNDRKTLSKYNDTHWQLAATKNIFHIGPVEEPEWDTAKFGIEGNRSNKHKFAQSN